MSAFEEYFTAIGIGEPIKNRIKEVFEKVKKLYPNVEFVDVSINDYVDEENIQHYTDIRFYSSKIIVNAPDFLARDMIVAHGLRKNFLTLTVESSDYDLIQANEKSRLHVMGWFIERRTSMELNGSGINCDYLFEIFKKYFLPRLVL